MSSKFGIRIGLPVLALCLASVGVWYALPFLTGWAPEDSPTSPATEHKPTPLKSADPAAQTERLERRFATEVRPFLRAIVMPVTARRSRKPPLILARTRPWRRS